METNTILLCIYVACVIAILAYMIVPAVKGTSKIKPRQQWIMILIALAIAPITLLMGLAYYLTQKIKASKPQPVPKLLRSVQYPDVVYYKGEYMPIDEVNKITGKKYTLEEIYGKEYVEAMKKVEVKKPQKAKPEVEVTYRVRQDVVKNVRPEYIEEKAPIHIKVPELELVGFCNDRPLVNTQYINTLDNNELIVTREAQRAGRLTGRYKPYTLRESAAKFNANILSHLASNDKDKLLEILDCYKRAYNDGIIEAGNNLAIIYIKYTHEVEKGKALLIECAEKGCPNAITNYFTYLWREESNYEEAIRFGQTTPILTGTLAWNMAVLYLRGDHLDGNPLLCDNTKAKTYLQAIRSGRLAWSSGYNFFVEYVPKILEHIDDYNQLVVTARDYLYRTVRECVEVDKGSFLAGVYLTGMLEHIRFRMEDGVALRLADDSQGYGDTSRFYLCTKENEDYVEVAEDLEVIPYMIVDKSPYGAWEVYLYSKTRNIYPYFWHGAYRRETLLFSDSDLGLIKPLHGLDKNYVLDGERIEPKVWFEGDVAYVSSFYWNAWNGLIKETMKLVFDGNKIVEYETIAKENFYKYNCGIMF